MRIRSTKPEFWRSQTIAELDWETRLVLKALESYVDDNGVGKDKVVIFCADAFPHDLANSPETFAKVSRSLSRLSETNLIVRYKVAGEPLVYVRRWKQLQYIDKPRAGRYPRPDGTLNYRDEVDESIGAGHGVTDPVGTPDVREDCAKPSPKPPETCPQIQSGEQGNRGTGESSVVALVGGSGGKATNTARGTRLPENWMPPRDVVAQMRSDHPHVDIKTEHAKFLDYWHGKAGANARKADWPATWRNWMRRAGEQRNGHSPPPVNGIGKPTLKALGYQQAADQIIAEMERDQ